MRKWLPIALLTAPPLFAADLPPAFKITPGHEESSVVSRVRSIRHAHDRRPCHGLGGFMGRSAKAAYGHEHPAGRLA